MKKQKDYTIVALLIPFCIAVLFNLPACNEANEKQGEDQRKYDYGIVKKGDRLYIYKDGKPIGCSEDSTGKHEIGDIIAYGEGLNK